MVIIIRIITTIVIVTTIILETCLTSFFFLLLGSFVNLNDAWKLLFLNYYMVVQYFCTITIRLETEVFIIIVIYQ